MLIVKTLARVNLLLFTSLCLGLLPACGGGNGSKINNDDVTYVPETRPLGVIAGDNAEYEKGQTITLSGRLVGTVTTQAVRWEQIGGTPITGVSDWTTPNLTFPSPDVDGLETFKFRISARDSADNIINDASGNPLVDEIEILVYDPAVIITLEAEDTAFSTLVGGATLVNNGSNYITGAVGSHTADITPGAKVIYQIPSGSTVGDKTIGAGFYTLFVRYAIPASYGGKEAVVKTNGVDASVQFLATSSWNNARVDVIKINEGDNSIEIGGGWNYYRIDSILLIPAPQPTKPLAVAPTLVNANATAATKDVMTFLVSSYGAKTLSGQTEYMDYNDLGNKTGLRDFNKVTEMTGGQSPAIVAFDLMDYSSSRINCGAEPGFLSEDMISEHNTKNVILSPLWHWNSPTQLKDSNCSGSGSTAWYSGFYTTATNFNLKNALADQNSADYQALISDMDDIAAELKKFADADIPLLWRPLHEAEGGWFWWGASDAASLKALWQLMYQRFTEVHQLNNLIWVYTAAGSLSADWYPGDAYVDIVGYDGYDGKNAGNPFKTQFTTLKDRFDGKKLIALTETGTVPDIALMQQQNAWWAYFVTWSSEGSSEYGPQNADAAEVKASYEFEGTLNLDDVPGGRAKVEAGLYDGFELSVSGWGAQINWGDVPGAMASSGWAAQGGHALSVTKNLSTVNAPGSVVLQAYPPGGIDVADKQTLTLVAHSANAGTNTTAKLFVKHGDDWAWVDSGAVSTAGDVILTIDVSALEKLQGIGVQFEGFDPTSTMATFAIDKVMLDDAVLYDFEPAISPWEGQVNWAATAGATLSGNWKNTGSRSLGLIKDLTKENAPNSVILQAYPTGGIDVSSKQTLTLVAHSANAGAGTTAKLFVKHGDNWEWLDSGAVSATGNATLQIDVSALTTLQGLGVQFEGFDITSTAAGFYIDTVKLDNEVVYDFEGTGKWEFQKNWSPEAGIHLASEWSKSGGLALAGTTQLQNGDDNIILQIYPTGGVLLGDVTTLKISVHAANTGNTTQVQLFAKDKDYAWKDGGAVALVNGSADLTLDISTMGGELSGFGVRFMGPVNSATESSYYIDDVSFE
ncbi:MULTISPECIES: glycosyl hydrolase [unclassified Cellvibrio]|uniref:glycosyl hydrolase n=1 Tax=unclassified Cellvibrio TaxID=2624793 RepID=UPI000A00A446|nr:MULTISPECIES: glycosyl hydrolase [unclassified Cellvibrio]QEY17013.1 mannan endo-1,4-beta-mannosidase [Cellvibrio sp. KY-GH-1]